MIKFKDQPVKGDSFFYNNIEYNIYKVNKYNIWCGLDTFKDVFNKKQNKKFSKYMKEINAINFDYVIENNNIFLSNKIRKKIKIYKNIKENEIKKIKLEEDIFLIFRKDIFSFVILVYKDFDSFLIEYNIQKNIEKLLLKSDKISISNNIIYYSKEEGE